MMLPWLYPAMSLLLLAHGASGSDLQSLVLSVMDSYDARIHPIGNGEDEKSINVTLFYKIFMIHSYDDLRGELTILGTIRAQWSDYRLQWLPANFSNIRFLVLPKTEIWHPEFEMQSSVDSFRLPGKRGSRVKIRSSGSMDYSSTDLLTIICSADVRDYPYDTQHCSATIEPNGYTANRDIIYHLDSHISEEVTTENSEWKVKKVTFSVNADGNFVVDLVIERRHVFSILTMNIPMYILCAINPAVFLLPPESGERVSFSVTTFLSFTVYISILSDQIPAGSDPIADFVAEVFMMLVYSVLILLVTIISLRLHHNVDTTSVPRWAQRLTFATRCRCCRKSRAEWSKRGQVAAIDEISIKKQNDHSNTRPQCQYSVTEVTWHDMCNTFDMFMIFVFYFVYCVCMVVFHA